MRSAGTVANFIGAVVSLATIAACRPTRTVKLAWDVPAVLPNGYRIFVDDQMVMDITPPSSDPSCKCLSVSVPVARGPHTLKVVPYNLFGDGSPSVVGLLK